MSKKEKEIVENPFEGFNILKNPTLEKMKIDQETKELEEIEKEVIEESEEDVEPIAEAKETIKTSTKEVKKEEDSSEDEIEEEEVPENKTKVTKEPIKKEEETEEGFSFVPFVKHLAEKGIIDVTDTDDIEDSDLGFEKAIELTTKRGIDKAIAQYKESLPEELHKLAEFVELGGDPKQFLDLYYGERTFEGIDLSDEDTQKEVVKEGLRLSGWEENEIDEEIKDYEDLGKLEIKAKSHLVKLQNNEKLTFEEIQKIAFIIKYWDDLKDNLFKKEELNGFPLNKKIKEEVWDFMSRPDKKTGKTKLQEHNETNIDAQFLYAYLAYNNWDISKLEKSVKTKVTSELRGKLGKFTDTRTKLKSGRSEVQKDEEDPFAAFKTK